MRKKCLAWKSGLAGAIAREKMTIFWLGKPRGVFRIEFVIFPFFGALILQFWRNFAKKIAKLCKNEAPEAWEPLQRA